MKVLIVEDDFTSRKLLQMLLSPYGACDVAVTGTEALEAFEMAHGEKRPYDLVCLDIMLPEMDGQAVLKAIRAREREMGLQPQDEVKIIMTTALGAPKDVIEAYYRGGCNSYLVKPIDRKKLFDQLREFKLLS